MALSLRSKLKELPKVTKWVNGKVTDEDLKNRIVLFHFWSISCGMCKDSFEDLKEIKRKYKDVFLVGIHMPRSEEDTNLEKVEEEIKKYALKHPQALDNTHSMTDLFENEYVPSFYLYDKNGLLRHRSAGQNALTLLNKTLERVVLE